MGTVIKKILAVVVLLIAIVAVLFLVFSIFKRIFARNEKISLTYWGLWEDEEIMQPLIDEYQRNNSNVTITYIKESPRQYRERLQATIAKGTGPDIFRFHNTWLPMLRNELSPAPTKTLSANDVASMFYPVVTTDLVVDDAVYGVPLVIDGLGIFYNDSLLKAAGVAPPTTWDELQEAAQKVVVKDDDGNIITGGIALGTVNNVEHFSDILAVMMMQNGADLLFPVSAEAQEALQFYRLFAESPNNVWDSNMDNSIFAFANENVAMIVATSWEAQVIRDINPNLEFKVIPIPQLPGANISWATYWVEGVSSQSKHQEEAWKFLKFLSSKEAQEQFYTEASNARGFGQAYSRVDLGSTLIDDPILGAFVQQAPLARSFFLSSRTFDNGINDRMIKYAEDAVNSMTQGAASSSVVEVMASGFSQILSNFGI